MNAVANAVHAAVRTWSPYQEAIFAFGADPQAGNAVIEAVAGSGKTTTIVEMLHRVKGDVIFLAFNKSIANELGARGVNARTFHSLCAGPVRAFTGGRLDADKLRNLMFAAVESGALTQVDATTYGSFARRLVGLAKNSGIGCLVQDTEENWASIVDYHDLEIDDDRGEIARGIQIARALLAASNESMDYDFDDMLYRAVQDGIRLPIFDMVCIDEAQDTNMIQRAIIRKIMHGGSRLIAVGDPAQCHPPGTMIQLTGGKRMSIESVRVGDEVVTYHDCFRGIAHQGRKVLAKKGRAYTGEMLTLDAGAERVRVTPNHLVPTRLRDDGVQRWCVYVMEYGHSSRLGCCQLMYHAGFGVAARIRHEQATAGWVLKVFADKDAAKLYETKMSLCYGISENIFAEKGALKADLLEIIGDNRTRTTACLKQHGLCYEYPLIAKGDGKHVGRYLYITEACNLIAGINELRTYDGTRDGGGWEPVSITSVKTKTTVYSLSVEPTEGGHRLYVADDVLMHNCIYGFRGSDSNSMDLIAEEFGCARLPLTVSYRCPRRVVEHARQWVEHIESAPDAPEGVVTTLDTWTPATFTVGDMIVCRTTAPLIGVAYALLRAKVAVRVLGKEIGQGLTALVKKMNTTGLDRLAEKLEAYAKREVERAVARGNEEKAAAVADKVESILCLMEALVGDEKTVPGLIRLIDSLFNDREHAVQLSTIHKAKGLEADRVFWLDSRKQPSKWARKPHHLKQEHNIMYVATTRARRELIMIDSESRGY